METDLPDYEYGELFANIECDKRWFEFWKPKHVKVRAGIYTRIGDTVNFNIKFGEIYVSGNAKKGYMCGMIKGLPHNN